MSEGFRSHGNLINFEFLHSAAIIISYFEIIEGEVQDFSDLVVSNFVLIAEVHDQGVVIIS